MSSYRPIRIRRGTKANLPAPGTMEGELRYCTDTKQLYLDTAEGNLLINAPIAALTWKGAIDCSGNPNYPAATLGDTYFVSVAGKIGGASGLDVTVGDMLICNTTAVAGNHAAVGSYWDMVDDPFSIYDYLLIADIDDTPVNGEVDAPISSNWAYEHTTAADPHTGYRLESADHTHASTGAQAGQLDHGLAMTAASLLDNDHPQYLLLTDIDDTAVNGVTDAPISSNWAYDHAADTSAHGLNIVSPGLEDTPVDGHTTLGITSNWAYDHTTLDNAHPQYLLKTTYDAYSILAADTDNTPAAITLAASQLIGRKATGGIVALTKADLQTIINVADGANAYVHPNHSGEVTSVADGALTITNNAVTLAKLATQAAETVLANATSGTAVPTAVELTEQSVLGRVTGGHVAPITIGIANDNIVQIDSADAADNEYARFTASGLEGRTASEVYTDLMAQVLLENDAIKLDAALSADGKYNGITRTGLAGATLAFGDVCYFATSDSRWKLADADQAATAQGLLGICVLAAASDGDATNMLLIGTVRADTAFPSFTVGAPVYLSTTDGDLTSTAPSGTGDIIRVVGQAWTANELWFCPSPDFFEYKA